MTIEKHQFNCDKQYLRLLEDKLLVLELGHIKLGHPHQFKSHEFGELL